MTYTGVVFSLKSGFKKIMLTQELNLVLNQISQKKVIAPGFPLKESSMQNMKCTQ